MIDVRTGAIVYVVIGVTVVRIVLRNDDVKVVTTGSAGLMLIGVLRSRLEGSDYRKCKIEAEKKQSYCSRSGMRLAVALRGMSVPTTDFMMEY